MNLKDLIHVLEVGVNRNDLEGDYPNWVNQALLSITQDNNWNCMRTSDDFTILTGQTSVALSSDFKGLTQKRSPVGLVDSASGGRIMPCDVRFLEDIERPNAFLSIPRSTTFTRFGPDVYLHNDGNRWFLNVIDATSQDLVFRVKYFRFLPKLINDTDSNHMTETYPEMVKAKVRSVGFEEIGDPMAATAEATYELKKKKAINHDRRAWLAGRRLQMGG